MSSTSTGIDHPTEKEFALYLLNAHWQGERSKEVQDHLPRCADCRALARPYSANPAWGILQAIHRFGESKRFQNTDPRSFVEGEYTLFKHDYSRINASQYLYAARTIHPDGRSIMWAVGISLAGGSVAYYHAAAIFEETGEPASGVVIEVTFDNKPIHFVTNEEGVETKSVGFDRAAKISFLKE